MAGLLVSLSEGVGIALDAIRANKVRAGLTILGIAVGVFVVTVMAAAVHGINAGVEQSMAAAGPTTFFVSKWPMGPSSCNGSADSCPWRRWPRLTVEESKAVAAQPGIASVVAETQISAAAKYGSQSMPALQLNAYSAGWPEVEAGTIDPGRSFTAAENDNAAQVIVINDALRKQFFPNSDPLGRSIELDGRPFQVIGVFQPMGNFFDSGNQPAGIIPIESARRRLNASFWGVMFIVKPQANVQQDVAIDQTIAAIRSKRMLRPAEDNNFFIKTQEKIMETYNQIVGVFFIVMISLSAIGLLVGGVGVVAIMMISVTERTREIGVRKALGATSWIILWQFLVEAATLTLIGAGVGLIGGGAISWLLRSATPVKASIPPAAIAASLGVAAFTGIVFGLIPAARAARLDPVEALRYE